MAEQDNTIIYLEHDAEITEAIDKLKKSAGDSVRIVVPPRSPLLQSVVNLKLLKKAANSKKKELILVTGDKTATALAGKVGLLVAKNVKAEAKVPEGKPEPTKHGTSAAASAAIAATALAAQDEDKASSKAEGLPVTRYDEPDKAPRKQYRQKDESTPRKKGRGKKVPNYNKFQKWIWIGAGIVAFLVLSWLASAFVQTATVNVQAAADKRTVNTQFTLVTSGTSNSTTIAATALTTTKDLSQSVEATGQKDIGAKASGTVAVKNCEDTDSKALPAGAKLTTGGKTFTTNASASIPGGSFSGGGTVCKSSSVNVAVTAVENGDSYNFSNASFTVVGLSSRIGGTGSTSGGVSKILKVVSQSDVDNAVQALIDTGKAEALTQLKSQAKDTQKVFDETIKGEALTQAASPSVGSEASNTTVNVKVKYTVLAADQSELTKVVEASLKSDLRDGAKVLDAGLDQAKITQKSNNPNGAVYALATTAYIGQPIDEAALRKQVAGKSKKDVPDIAKQYSSVTGATVSGWPLVPNMPIPTNNIKVVLSVSK